MSLRMKNGQKEPINLHGSQQLSTFLSTAATGQRGVSFIESFFFSVGPANQTYMIDMFQSVCGLSRHADR